jgi:MFS family permease
MLYKAGTITTSSREFRGSIPRGQPAFFTLTLASLGGALEFYDFIIFAFFAPVIGRLFFPAGLADWARQLQTFGIFAVGYFARPLGGIVMAHFGDVRGRKRIFTVSVLLMAIPTLLIGFLPTYTSIGTAAPLLLLAMRIMQGIAIGGEAPSAWVFAAEHARQWRAGFAVWLLTSGLSCGILLGSLVAVYINSAFSQAEITGGVWRFPFLLGGVFGFIAVLLRRYLAETPVFEEMRRRAAIAQEMPLRTVLRNYKRAIAMSMLSTWMLTAVIVVVILISPSLLQNLFHISPRSALQANLAGCAALCFSTVAVGAATDRFKIRRVSLVMSALLILGTYALYAGAERMPSALVPLYILAGIGAGCAALAPIAMVAAFPPALRVTGVSVSYNMAYAVFGGVTPLVVSSLSHLSPLAAPHYVAVATLAGLSSIVIGASPDVRDDTAR